MGDLGNFARSNGVAYAGDDFGGFGVGSVVACVEEDLMSKVVHHYGEATNLLGVGATCEVLIDLRVRKCDDVKTH